MYQLLLFGHLIGVGLLVLGTGVFLAGTEGLRRAGSSADLRAAAALAHAGTWLLAPGGLTLLTFGLVLVADSWSFTEPWIVASLLLVGVLGANGVRSERWLGRVQHALRAAGNDIHPIVRAPAHHGANRATLAVLAEIEFLMTVKPAGTALFASVLVAAVAAAALALSTAARPAPTHPG